MTGFQTSRTNRGALGIVAVAGACIPMMMAAGPADVKTVAQPTIKTEKDMTGSPLAFPGAPVAQAKQEGFNPADLMSAPAFEWSTVHYDTAADGSVWARGKTYKAHFAADQFTYIPFMGSDAPRNYPMTFSLGEVRVGGKPMAMAGGGQVVREGDRVTINHGGVVERYDLATDSVEQSFVFDSLPAGGLVVRLNMQSELGGTAAAQGLKFGNERGEVSYTKAIVYDAAGQSMPMQTTIADGVVELKVPASFLRNATFPVTVDPVLQTYAGTSGSTHRLADVAYDLTTDRYCVVWENQFSFDDNDILMAFYTGAGQLISEGTVEFTSSNWSNPSVANNRLASQFMAVAEVGTVGSRNIMGRTIAAATGALGAVLQVNGGESGDKLNPVIGGDPSSVEPTYYCVAWERIATSTDHDIHARQINTDGTTHNNVLLIDNTGNTIDSHPAISKSDGDGGVSTTQVWTIVWQRTFSSTDHDIRGAQVRWDGDIVFPSFAIDISSTNDERPAVSSILDPVDLDFRDCLVVYQEGAAAGPRTLYGRVIKGDDVVTGAFLSNLEGVSSGLDHVNPSTDSDGSKFIVAHSEYFDTGDYDVYVSAFCMDSNDDLVLAESHRNMDFSFIVDHPVRITAAHSGGANSSNFMGVWTETGSLGGHGQIYRGIYQAPSTCCRADVNDDGVIDIDDLFTVINAWGPCITCQGDIDGSLEADINDLFLVISDWGPCAP